MPLIGIMGARDERWVPREKIHSLLDVLSWLYLRAIHSCADVWQTIQMLVWNSRKKL